MRIKPPKSSAFRRIDRTMTEPAIPSVEWLAESKRANNVPTHWQWSRCCGCNQITWYDPEVRAAAAAAGKKFYLSCSAGCVIAIISTQ